MNLYLISQEENNDWDTFDSAVVCAPDAETARKIDPVGIWKADTKLLGWWEAKRNWAAPAHVKAQLVGQADPSIEPLSVVCASYNAG